MVLVVSVGDRGCAIPVAWTVPPATETQAWRGEWLRMLRRYGPSCRAASLCLS